MFIVFDVGATKIRVAASKNLRDLGDVKVTESSGSLEEVADKIQKLSFELTGGKKIKAIGGGITAAIDKTDGKKLTEILKTKFGTKKVFIGNDAAVVGLGEAHFGAGKGFSIVEYITVSTGIGGARIVDGKIDKASVGFEPGHQIIKFEGENRESLQDLASGRGVSQKFHKNPKEILDQNVWNDLAYTLAIGVYNSILFWSPEVVVLGGPMIVGDPAIPIEKVREHVGRLIKVLPRIPEIKSAELKDDGGLIGGLILIKNKGK